MLKQFKIITLAPKCFSSHRNHPQGAVLCLAKTTACCAGVRFTVVRRVVHGGEPHTCTTG